MSEKERSRKRGFNPRQEARYQAQYERELTRRRGIRKPGEESLITSRDAMVADNEAEQQARRSLISEQRASQGLPPLPDNSGDMRGVRERSATFSKMSERPTSQGGRESFADTEKRKREELSRSGAFGKKAQNQAERRALFSEMEQGGDMSEMRKRAAKLGVDDKGWDVAQARLSRTASPADTSPSTPTSSQVAPVSDPNRIDPSTAGVSNTAGNYIADFEKAAMETEMPEQFTPEQMNLRQDTFRKENERLATNRGLDERLAADAAAVKAAQEEGRRMVEPTKVALDNSRKLLAEEQSTIGARRAEADANLAAVKADADQYFAKQTPEARAKYRQSIGEAPEPAVAGTPPTPTPAGAGAQAASTPSTPRQPSQPVMQDTEARDREAKKKEREAIRQNLAKQKESRSQSNKDAIANNEFFQDGRGGLTVAGRALSWLSKERL